MHCYIRLNLFFRNSDYAFAQLLFVSRIVQGLTSSYLLVSILY